MKGGARKGGIMSLLSDAEEIIKMAQELNEAGYKDLALVYAMAAAQRIQLARLLEPAQEAP